MKKNLAQTALKDVQLQGQGRSAIKDIGKGPLSNQTELNQLEQERWQRDQATLRRAAEHEACQRNEPTVNSSLSLPVYSFDEVVDALDDPSPETRHQAVRLLYELEPERAASFFNIALREGSSTERRNIGAALAGSGLLDEAIKDLMGDNPENSYSAFSFLFLVAKAGEVQPLVKVIRNHPSLELRLTLIRLLAESGDPDIIPAFRDLSTSSLPVEISTAIMDVINKRDTLLHQAHYENFGMKKNLATTALKDVPLQEQGRSAIEYLGKGSLSNQTEINQLEQESWQRDQAILRRAAEHNAAGETS
jgi:HEAT repeat protein